MNFWLLVFAAVLIIAYDLNSNASKDSSSSSLGELMDSEMQQQQLGSLQNFSYWHWSASSESNREQQRAVGRILHQHSRIRYRNSSLRFHNISSVNNGHWNISWPLESIRLPTSLNSTSMNSTVNGTLDSPALDSESDDYFQFWLSSKHSDDGRSLTSKASIYLQNNATVNDKLHFIYGSMRLRRNQDDWGLALNLIGFHFTVEGLVYFVASQNTYVVSHWAFPVFCCANQARSLRPMVMDLLSVLPTERHRNDTIVVLEDRRLKRIEDIWRQLNGTVADIDKDEKSVPRLKSNCSFFGKMVVALAPNYVESASEIYVYENELEIPSGKSTINEFPLEMQTEMVSINCNCTILMETSGIQMARYNVKVSRFLGFSAVLAFLEILFTIHQLRGRLSTSSHGCYYLAFWTFGFQCVQDAFLCVFYLTFTISSASAYFAPFLSVAFMKLILFAIFEARLLVGIVQAHRLRDPSYLGGGGGRSDFLPVYLRMYLILALFYIFFSVLPHKYRIVILLFLNSYWIPQIVWNLRTGVYAPLSNLYIFGITSTRLLSPYLYSYGCPENIVTFETSPLIVGSLIIWSLLQLIMLLYQRYFGPHHLITKYLPFWFAKHFIITRYDYHRSLSSLNPGNEGKFDCAICLTFISPADRESYMIPPCDHPFHTECLQRWMQRKMDCPVCRKRLPE